mgnify:FL=1
MHNPRYSQIELGLDRHWHCISVQDCRREGVGNIAEYPKLEGNRDEKKRFHGNWAMSTILKLAISIDRERERERERERGMEEARGT